MDKDISMRHLSSVQSIAVVFDDNVSHTGILHQILTKLERAEFAPMREMIQEWATLLTLESEKIDEKTIIVKEK